MFIKTLIAVVTAGFVATVPVSALAHNYKHGGHHKHNKPYVIKQHKKRHHYKKHKRLYDHDYSHRYYRPYRRHIHTEYCPIDHHDISFGYGKYDWNDGYGWSINFYR